MQLKLISTMLIENRVQDLAYYIKAGNSILGACLFPILDELLPYGIDKAMLTNKGAVVSFEEVMKKLETQLFDLDDLGVVSTLQHYAIVIPLSVKRWEMNKLSNQSELAFALNARAKKYLYGKMLSCTLEKSPNDDAYIDFLNTAATAHIIKLGLESVSHGKWFTLPRKIIRAVFKSYRSLVRENWNSKLRDMAISEPLSRLLKSPDEVTEEILYPLVEQLLEPRNKMSGMMQNIALSLEYSAFAEQETLKIITGHILLAFSKDRVLHEKLMGEVITKQLNEYVKGDQKLRNLMPNSNELFADIFRICQRILTATEKVVFQYSQAHRLYGQIRENMDPPLNMLSQLNSETNMPDDEMQQISSTNSPSNGI
jgi:hypothetical protein